MSRPMHRTLKKTIKCNIKNKTKINQMDYKKYKKFVRMKLNNFKGWALSIRVPLNLKTQRLWKEPLNKTYRLHQPRKNRGIPKNNNKYNHLLKDSRILKGCRLGLGMMRYPNKTQNKQKSNRKKHLQMKNLSRYHQHPSKIPIVLSKQKRLKSKKRWFQQWVRKVKIRDRKAKLWLILSHKLWWKIKILKVNSMIKA